ncbi:phage/plasmid primase, P4 family [Levilactobacillus brevis]|uniref:phage/plasmid primase, P4 family n=1 Tax=Levilactobacillus brevis TaxID=1580 RepID=UPI000E0319E1|nr:phage/plasmid primase, P4 family [Levilactobacillus brevis]STX19330.1 phage/plasmid primase, P4 family [Levilactobacillus brevis]
MYERIPQELKSLKQWGLFKLIWKPERNKYTKIPIDPYTGHDGKSNDPQTWADFDTALQAMQDLGMDGLGFYFTPPYVGIDVDHIGADLDRWKRGDTDDNEVQRFLTITKSYAETSVSGTGLHIIVKGRIPGDRRRKGPVEMYTTGRFFAMTGELIGSYPEVNEPDPKLMQLLYDRYLKTDNVVKLPADQLPQLNDLSESEIITRAESSRTGQRFKLFMNGGWESLYTSQSEADLAFANDLAFWTGRDFTKMDSIFRQSSLMRPKWDERHGKTNYGVATLNKAINETHDVFTQRKAPLKYQFEFAKKDQPKKKKVPPRSWDDTGNTDRFMDQYGDLMKYSFIDKNWMIYNGSYWEIDETGQVHSLADQVIDSMKHEKLVVPPDSDLTEEKAMKAFQKHIKHSRSNSGKKALIDEIKHRVPVLHGEFDSDKTLLNVANGYVDLTSGLLHEHDITKMFSRQTRTEYTDTIDAPEWQQFLDQIFNKDQELIDYVQKAVGYSLTGSTKEQVMFILYGNGRNGKSIFIDTIADALGNYARSMQADSIMVKQNKSAANSDIARLEGARLVTSSEPNDGLRLDEGLVKQLTGGDTVTARYLYGKEFEFKPEFKLWLATNHKPIIRGTDDGIWRRLMLIPFAVKIPDNRVDKDLKYKLQREEVGILNWAVEGALKWQREGLKAPESVRQASRDYRNEMDVTSEFLEECCTLSEHETVRAAELYRRYKNWAGDNSQYLMNSTKFGKEMMKKFDRKRDSQGNYYLGLSVNEIHQPFEIITRHPKRKM